MGKKYQGLGSIEYKIERIIDSKERLHREIQSTRPIEQRKRRLIAKRLNDLRKEHEIVCTQLFNEIARCKRKDIWETDIEHTL